MVASSLVLNNEYQYGISPMAVSYAELPQEEDIKWCTVSLADVINAKKRLEAAVFDVDGKHACEVITNCKWESVPLPQILNKAYYPGRFKRIYSDTVNGAPFYLPSQMTDIYPKPEKYISALTKCDISELRLKLGDVLLTRSGTIGNVTIVSKTLENTIFSDDVIRITPNGVMAGFVYSYLRSKIGSTILATNRYGSVIQHIEPDHLADISIPNPPDRIKIKINDFIMRSFSLRDESNELIDKATDLLIDALKLPPVHEFETSRFDNNSDVNNYNVKLSELSGRLDGSYHVPVVAAIKEHLQKHAAEVTTVGDSRISKAIILPGRFKRVYVDEGQGVKFLGGKEIFQLNPNIEKYISIKAHKNQLEAGLSIKENSIITPARGTLGSVALSPPHFYGWAISDNLMQIIGLPETCGYLYIFLNSSYGSYLIKRFTYGGVVDALEPSHLGSVEIPLLKDTDAQAEINNLALEANELRYQAYTLEQEAMKVMDEEVIYAKRGD